MGIGTAYTGSFPKRKKRQGRQRKSSLPFTYKLQAVFRTPENQELLSRKPKFQLKNLQHKTSLDLTPDHVILHPPTFNFWVILG